LEIYRYDLDMARTEAEEANKAAARLEEELNRPAPTT
jgi:hypothetical protein